jgi:preprotein translocase subunit Sec61beta
MAKKKEGSGLMSSAGLMRYYDAEETAILIDPKTVVSIAVVAGLAILALNAYYGIWP